MLGDICRGSDCRGNERPPAKTHNTLKRKLCGPCCIPSSRRMVIFGTSIFRALLFIILFICFPTDILSERIRKQFDGLRCGQIHPNKMALFCMVY